MGIPFPDFIDPILLYIPAFDVVDFTLGPFAIRWYAVSYLLGLLLGWYYIGVMNKKQETLTLRCYDNIVVWLILGVIIGGRLGYVLFYNLDYYLHNPSSILAVWQGGMSFHGGLVGVIIAMYVMCLHYQLQFMAIIDMIAIAAPIGLFFGRIANFINAELYGRITDVPWAVIFPGDPFARHPSQLYEALLEGLVLFTILAFFAFKRNCRNMPGKCAGIFLAGYGSARFTVEFFRAPDPYHGLIMDYFTMGQLLCIPMILLGVYLIINSHQRTLQPLPVQTEAE